MRDQSCWNHEKNTLISLNISAASLTSNDLIELLKPLVSDPEISNKKVILEITETATMSNPENAKALINKLSNEGFRFALDDFGTGYSSLTNLRNLRIDEIKIDKSFIQDLDHQTHTDKVLIDAILSIAHAFGAIVVAEGIETEETLLQLKSMNCYAGQGYIFTKPMPASAIDDWYEQWPAQWRQLAHQESNAVI